MPVRVRNANTAMHDKVVMPSSKLKEALAKILVQEGYIAGFNVSDNTKRLAITGPCKRDWRSAFRELYAERHGGVR